MTSDPISVLIWNENVDEQRTPEVRAVYPDGIHGALAKAFERDGRFAVKTATMDEEECGLSEDALVGCDVLMWWSHHAHEAVPDTIVERVRRHVLDGMGLIVLHSAFMSKVFKALMGTTCDVKWRNAGEKERLWVVAPGHPIVEGLCERIELAQEEMYGEPFDVPPPDELVFVSWFQGGEVFRSGCCYRRGRGRVFYFRPGHGTYPTYWNPQVQTMLRNAARWAARVDGPPARFGQHDPLEPLG